jgi:hypothetical protein
MLQVPAGTQAAPHATLPAGQLQTPLAQTLPPGHRLPHAPQFAWSLARSAQAPLGHVVRLHVAEHAEFEQYGVAPPHTTPQLPQLLRSEIVFTQPVPHWRSPGAQTQPPFEHASPGGQRTPQLPQLLGSNPRFVHTPPHT